MHTMQRTFSDLRRFETITAAKQYNDICTGNATEEWVTLWDQRSGYMTLGFTHITKVRIEYKRVKSALARAIGQLI